MAITCQVAVRHIADYSANDKGGKLSSGLIIVGNIAVQFVAFCSFPGQGVVRYVAELL